MNLAELQTFLKIVETGSLVETATRLNVTQSTVTARLKSLEAALDQKLINRKKSGATMTAAGFRLQRYAQTISELWYQAKQETGHGQEVKSVYNMACHPDLWNGLGERMFNSIHHEQPNAALSIWHGSDQEISGWIKNGLVNLALTYSAFSHAGHKLDELEPDKLILVSTDPNSPLRFDPGYVYVEAGEEFGRRHAAEFSNASTTRTSFGSAQPGLDFILKHGGTAYLPHRLVRHYLNDKRLFKLGEAPEFERRIFMSFSETLIELNATGIYNRE